MGPRLFASVRGGMVHATARIQQLETPSQVLRYSASISETFEATRPDSAARAVIAGAQQFYRAKGLLKLLLCGAQRATTGCEIGLLRREAAAST